MFKIVLLISILLLLLLDTTQARKKKKPKVPAVSAIDSDCYFDIPKDIPKNEPVYLRKNAEDSLEILHPSGPRQRFQIDEEITLFCPTKNNKFTQGNFIPSIQ